MSRIRANKITNKLGTGAVELEKGAHLPVGMGITGAGSINLTGIITAATINATTFQGIDSTALKDSGGNIKVQAQAYGAVYTGIHTFTTLNSSTGTFSGAIDANGDLDVDGHTNLDNVSISGVATVTGNLNVGGVLTYEDVTNIDSVGLITARNGIKVTGGTSFFAESMAVAGGITGTASTATTITVASDTTDTLCFPVFTNTGVGNNAPKVNTSKLSFNSATGALSATSFVGDGSGLSGIVAGISTEALVKTNGQTATLNLSKDDHKVTATGTVTIDVSGGTESSAHTLRIVNSGIATVGFSTYFLFPSGGQPSLPTASGAISLISFTIHRAGAVGVSTQLLSGASINFS